MAGLIRSSHRPATRLVTHSVSATTLLEDVPQSKLEVAHLRGRGQVEYSASFGRVTINAVPGLPKVDGVEYVVALCAEFQIRTFGYSESLKQREIALPEPWPA